MIRLPSLAQLPAASSTRIWLCTGPTDNREVDFVLQRRGGDLVGIEVKAAVKLNTDDFKGLADLAETTGKRFQAGIVLYGGSTSVPFGDKLWAVPITALFSES